jgi:uncharacterized protein (DUF2062 family)
MIKAVYWSKRYRKKVFKNFKNIRTYMKARKALRRRGIYLTRLSRWGR